MAYDLFVRKRKAYDLFLWWSAKAVPFGLQTIPDFLVIGSSRSGTTWLHHILRQHRDVFCPRVKEVHFFDRGSVRDRGVFKFDPENKAQWRWYALNFLLGKGKLIGDLTPAYACLDQQLIRVIAQRLPDIKIIYSFRNPVERAWSGVRKSFKENGVDKISHITEQELIERATTPNQYAASAYADNVERWESCFPTERIHYSFYDDLVGDPYEFLASICEFLGISIDPVSHLVSRQPVNKAPIHEPPPLVWEELVKIYKPHIEYLERRFHRDLSHWVTLPDSQKLCGSMK
jgi:hypothetical protein